jgi:hypothetical protein
MRVKRPADAPADASADACKGTLLIHVKRPNTYVEIICICKMYIYRWICGRVWV